MDEIKASLKISDGFHPCCDLIENENVKLLLKLCWDAVPEIRPEFENTEENSNVKMKLNVIGKFFKFLNFYLFLIFL